MYCSCCVVLPLSCLQRLLCGFASTHVQRVLCGLRVALPLSCLQRLLCGWAHSRTCLHLAVSCLQCACCVALHLSCLQRLLFVRRWFYVLYSGCCGLALILFTALALWHCP